MPKLKLRLTTAALRDLNDIFEYLNSQNPRAARSVINAIERSINLLTEYPMSARQTDMIDVRVRPLSKYPFLVFYQPADTELLVLRIRHSSGHWPDDIAE
jgi:toxin ParE1/3/4